MFKPYPSSSLNMQAPREELGEGTFGLLGGIIKEVLVSTPPLPINPTGPKLYKP